MIQWLQDNLKNSILIKGFLGLLMISFGIWGVGDFLTSTIDPKLVATVGKTDIGLDEVNARYTSELARYRQTFGNNLDSEDIKRSILNSMVQDMTRSATIDNAAEDMGLVIRRERLRAEIAQDPAFKDETGQFDQMLYARVLNENRLTENGFLRIYRQMLHQRAVLYPLANNAAAPQSLVDPLLAYRGETRIVDTLLVSTSAVPAPPAPSEDELKKTFQANISEFTLPEYRKISAVVLRSDELVAPDSLSDEQLKAYYDENIERYRTHETRHVAQIVFDTKDQAAAARAMAVAGDHLEDVAKKAKSSGVVDMGELPKTSPLLKTVGAAYDLPVGEISQPIESDLGWHLFEIKDVKPEVVRDFAAVREEIRKTMAEDKGTDALYDASQKLEDEITSGAPMNEAAERTGGKLITIDAVDHEGKDPRGLEAKGLFDNEKFLKAAFSLPAGSEGKLTEIPKGYYILRVEAITPPTPKKLEDVRKDVVAIYDKEKRLSTAREQADKIVAEAKGATTLAPLATKYNASLEQVGPVNRFGEAPSKDIIVNTKRTGPELREKIFAAKVGDVVSAPVNDGVVVARLREIVPPSATDLAKQGPELISNVRQGIANSLAAAVTQAYTERYPVKLNQTALDSLITTAQ